LTAHDGDHQVPDQLADFDKRLITLRCKQKPVFVAGSGPAVIVMAEMPGITPLVARFARWVRDAGFKVYMPNLFGEAGRPGGSHLYFASSLAKICISREFHLLCSRSSGPIADWLRELAKLAHRESGGKGVGAVGMCITGNFALSMMLEPAMLAPVLSQPSLPFLPASALHIAPDELQDVKERLDREDLTVRGYRFENDKFCKKERFAAYREALGDRFIGDETLRNSDANPAAGGNPHSVLTEHLIDKDGSKTREKRDEVLAFLRMRLQ